MAPAEKSLKRNMPDNLRCLLAPKRILLWEEMLKARGYTDLGVVAELKKRTVLTGVVSPTGVSCCLQAGRSQGRDPKAIRKRCQKVHLVCHKVLRRRQHQVKVSRMTNPQSLCNKLGRRERHTPSNFNRLFVLLTSNRSKLIPYPFWQGDTRRSWDLAGTTDPAGSRPAGAVQGTLMRLIGETGSETRNAPRRTITCLRSGVKGGILDARGCWPVIARKA